MNIPIEDIYVKQEDEIKLYVIGYESMGESIIINIAEKFFGVIDCYKTKDFFITKNILEELCVKKLDFICWTHTDADHTKGMIELFDYVDDNTAFIMPEGLSYKELLSKVDLKSEKYCNEEIVHIFEAIKSKIKEYNFVSANNGSSIYSFNLKLLNDEKSIAVNIESFAPLSSIVRNSQIRTMQELINESKKIHEKPNLFSVGLIINFIRQSFSLKICLAGDVDNITIDKMHPLNKKRIFNNNHIIKLPHHGSNNSDRIIKDNLITYFDYAVSTSYKKHRLPRQEVLDGYKKCCSHGKISKTNKTAGPYGYVIYKVPLFNDLEPNTEVCYVGTAGEV
ncbi:hypothetical protein [uncultured Clostridium sp.]|uniref:hypothetical protein n=1 Tax=uncultured Clostridium sp. TaxID=59620 RepID=UPI0025F9D255|nr:hypothetical protein [uncultured Clostridium sp.]